MRYDHIAFDLDGTLIDSRIDLAHAVNVVRGSFGLPKLPLDVITTYIGSGARMLVERGLGPAHAHLLEEGLQRFMASYGQHLLDHTRLYPGIAELLPALAQSGATLSVLSNKPEALSRTILDGLNVLSQFVAVLGGDSLPVRKPDPAGLLHLCALTGVQPERLLLVGDSPIDLHTARSAGAGFCGVAWGFGLTGLRAAGVEAIIEHPSDLLAIAEDRHGQDYRRS
jgi:phosphoglycolate phosphatase